MLNKNYHTTKITTCIILLKTRKKMIISGIKFRKEFYFYDKNYV